MRKKEVVKICAAMLSVLIVGSTTALCTAAQDFSDIEFNSAENQEQNDSDSSEMEDITDGYRDCEEEISGGELQETLTSQINGNSEESAEDISPEPTEDYVMEDVNDSSADDTEISSEITGIQGQMYSNTELQSFASVYRTGEVTGETEEYEGQIWKVINLTFETEDIGAKARQAWLRLKFTAEDQGRISIGRMYYKTNDTASGFLEYDDEQDVWDGGIAFFSMQMSTGSNPAKLQGDLYCIYKGEKGNSHYLIRVVRKGSMGIQREPYFGDTVPLSVKFIYNEETGGFEADENEALYALRQEQGIITYDSMGIPNGTLQWSRIQTDSSQDFYVDDSILYAKKAGQYPMYIASYGGKDYILPVRVTYNIRLASRLLGQLKTDGVISLDSFSDEKAFALAFPEKDQEQARSFYREERKLETVLNNTSGDGRYEEDWDHSLYEQAWTDDCESAKLEQIKAAAPGVWDNIYGIQDAKEKIESCADVEHAPAVQKPELEKVIKAGKEKLDSWYQEGKITDIRTVAEIVGETKNAVYRIKGIALADCKISLSYTETVYDGKAKTPKVSVTDSEGTVILQEFYKIEYKNNVNAGTASVVVAGTGMGKGVRTFSCVIHKASQKIRSDSFSYSRMEGSGVFSLKASSSAGLSLGYTSSNSKIVKVDKKGKVTVVGSGTAVIRVTASGNRNFEPASLNIRIQVIPKLVKMSSAFVTRTEGTGAFAGCRVYSSAVLSTKSSVPEVAVMDKKGRVTVKGPGRTVIAISAIANGVKEQKYKLTVTVKPSGKLAVSAISGKKSTVTVSWKKNSRVSGYQVVLSYDRSFRKPTKTVYVRNCKTGKIVIRGLKPGKTCYVRVRSFKKISSGTLYGDWGKKTVKIKK